MISFHRLCIFFFNSICAFCFLHGLSNPPSWNSQALVRRRNTETAGNAERQENYFDSLPNLHYRKFSRGRLKSSSPSIPAVELSSASLIEKLYNFTNVKISTFKSNLEISNRPFRRRTKQGEPLGSIANDLPRLGGTKGPPTTPRSANQKGNKEASLFPPPSWRGLGYPPKGWPGFALYPFKWLLPPSDELRLDVSSLPADGPDSAPTVEGVETPTRGTTVSDAAKEFYKHRIVTPKLYHARSKREITSTWNLDSKDVPHHHHITLGLAVDGQNLLVDLQLNRDLIPEGYFEKQLSKGADDIRRPPLKESGLCHYQGFIRDKPGSWAALSTCNGLKGVVYDGSDLHYVEPLPGDALGVTSSHYLLSHRDLIPRNLTCGYSGKPHPVRDLFHDEEFTRLLRYRRDTSRESIRGPYNSNSLSRYVELILVTDVTEFENYDKDENKIFQRCKDIANIVNALYQPLNIFIALVGVEVWKEEDQVEISTDGDKTLTKFLSYRKLRLIPKHPNDNAQLLTGKDFDSGVVGKALKGPICTYQYSGGVNMDHSVSVGLVATTVAHEMGHNFGMEHDTEEDCKCPDKRCIMSPSSGAKSPTHWSSCSHEHLAISFERSMDYCLRNKPTSLFNSPVCGNGFVEPGEQCDCGLPEHCANSCCNATACMLFNNATCATGHCCDLETCRPKEAGTECRRALHECDLPEYCSGVSEYCPNNFYKEDGHKCLGGQAYCYEGMCRTHEHQCRLLWGPTGKNSDDKCYDLNKDGNSHGNCGYNWATNEYTKCNLSDIKCGMMHCKHFNERLEFGMESVSKVTHRFIPDSQGPIPCRVAQVDLGLDMVDPGLAPDGAKCGYEKMCVNQHCIEVASLRFTHCECNGNGVCNNKGHCHCDIGFSYPDCIYPGLGGSIDSGPASNPNATNGFIIGMFIFFLGIVPLAVILLLAYYMRGNLKLWWLRKGIPATSRLSGKEAIGRPGSIAPGLCVEVVSKTSQINSSGKQSAEVCSPSPPSSQGSKSNSPLLNGYVNGPGKSAANSFFGKHEGFTLSPIKDRPKERSESEPPAIPFPKPLAMPLTPESKSPTTDTHAKSNSLTSPLSPGADAKAGNGGGSWKIKPNALPINAWPPVRKGGKVDISEPSLQASTNPAVEAPSQPAILRPAPPPPKIGPTPAAPTVAAAPNRHSISRPKSVPDASTLIVQQKSASLECDSSLTSPEGSIKESKQSTVSRIASFLSKKEKPDAPEAVQVGQSNTLPRKAAKINRESLLQLEISHPMQLQATELPSNLVPVRPAPDPPMPSNVKPSEVKAGQSVSFPQDKVVSSKVSWAPDVVNSQMKDGDNSTPEILRIGSVREHPVTTRPAIPKFGSMRAPRPKSLPPPTRPSQPPPRPPLPMIPGTPESEYFFDDSAEEGTRSAPLADSEEDPSLQESIYATIDDDSPESDYPAEVVPTAEVITPAKKEKKSIFSLLYSKTKKKAEPLQEIQEPLYCNVDSETSPDSKSNESQHSSIDRTSSGSTDCGLLSEIVSELANREPQYVNTLSKNKRSLSEEKPDSRTTKCGKDNSVQNRSLHSSPTKEAASTLKSQFHKEIPKATSQQVKDSKPISNSYLSSTKPRGVFSYLKKSNSEEASPSNASVISPPQSAKTTAQENGSSAAAFPPQKGASLDEAKSNKGKPSISDANISCSKSLGAVSAAAKEAPPLKKSATNTSNLKLKRDSDLEPKGSIKEEKSTPAANSVSASLSGNRRPAFPPDKVIPHDKQTASTKSAQASSAAKKTDAKPVKSRPITPSSSSSISGQMKPTRVTSPTRTTQPQTKSFSNSVASHNVHAAGPDKSKGVLAPKPTNLKLTKRASSAPTKPEIKAKSCNGDKLSEKDSAGTAKKDQNIAKGAQAAAKPVRAASAASAGALKSPGSSSKNGVLATAAKGTSHVASLQQRFEADSQTAKQSKLPSKKTQERPSLAAKPK